MEDTHQSYCYDALVRIFRRILSIMSLLYFLFWPCFASAQIYSNEGYCSKTGRTVIFAVDITTPYDEADKKSIVELTNHVLSSVNGGDKLVIRTIADSHAHSERLIQRCIPYCPAKGTFGRLFDCSDGLIRTHTEKMRDEVIGALRKKLSTFQELPYSDIVRSIVKIVNEDANPDNDLIVYLYSDLIENSDYFSSGYLFSYSTQKLLDGLKIYKQMANLKNAEIQVSGVGRAGTQDRHPLKITQMNKLMEFWTAYFRECGAKKVTISKDTALSSK